MIFIKKGTLLAYCRKSFLINESDRNSFKLNIVKIDMAKALAIQEVYNPSAKADGNKNEKEFNFFDIADFCTYTKNWK